MVSNKVIVIMIVIAVLLLLTSLFINMNILDFGTNNQEILQGNPEASINLVISPPLNQSANDGET